MGSTLAGKVMAALLCSSFLQGQSERSLDDWATEANGEPEPSKWRVGGVLQPLLTTNEIVIPGGALGENILEIYKEHFHFKGSEKSSS